MSLIFEAKKLYRLAAPKFSSELKMALNCDSISKSKIGSDCSKNGIKCAIILEVSCQSMECKNAQEYNYIIDEKIVPNLKSIVEFLKTKTKNIVKLHYDEDTFTILLIENKKEKVKQQLKESSKLKRFNSNEIYNEGKIGELTDTANEKISKLNKKMVNKKIELKLDKKMNTLAKMEIKRQKKIIRNIIQKKAISYNLKNLNDINFNINNKEYYLGSFKVKNKEDLEIIKKSIIRQTRGNMRLFTNQINYLIFSVDFRGSFEKDFNICLVLNKNNLIKIAKLTLQHPNSQIKYDHINDKINITTTEYHYY